MYGHRRHFAILKTGQLIITYHIGLHIYMEMIHYTTLFYVVGKESKFEGTLTNLSQRSNPLLTSSY